MFIERLAKAFAMKLPCRAGLMCFAICLEAATVGLIMMESKASDSSKADSSVSSAIAPEDDKKFDPQNSLLMTNEIGGKVLDSLHLVLEKIKNRFDPEYRAKGANSTSDISASVCFLLSEAVC